MTAPDTALAARLLREIHHDSRDGPGVTRDAYGPGEQRAHDRLAAEGRALGLDVAADAVGNLFLTLPGSDRSASRIIVGSHLDSVRQGGDYDGTVGVLAGLACLAGLRQAGIEPGRDITLLVTRAEESGEWFPVSFPGSRAALGTLPAEALAVRRADTGLTLDEHMRRAGFSPEPIRDGAGWLGPNNVLAFLELHIEQGPILEGMGAPLGIVTAIPGSRRYRQGRVVGETNHSGATPRHHRRDAAIAAAELAFRADATWERMQADGHHLTVTFCRLRTGDDAAFTRIAGSACFELDVRSAEISTLDRFDGALRQLAGEIGTRREVAIDLGPCTSGTPQRLDDVIQAELERAASELSIGAPRMVSGGGHDVAAFAAAGVPSGLLFVRNRNGSHSPREFVDPADFDTACAVLLRWLINRACRPA